MQADVVTGSQTIETTLAGAGDRAAWQAFVARAEGAELGHRWEFFDFLEKTFGLGVQPLVARRDGAIAGVLPLVLQASFLGKFLTSVPYLNYAGVLAPDPAVRLALAEEAVRLADRLGADRLEIRGRHGSDLPLPVSTAKACYVLDLPATSEELFKAVGTKLRTRIRRPQKNGYEPVTFHEGGFRELYPVLARRWHELGSPVIPQAFFENFEAAFGRDITYVGVRKDGATVACGLLLRVGDRIEIPWAASRGEHDSQGVNMLMYWHAFETSIGAGAKQFDFGRSTPGSGTADFKLQWGSAEVPLEWNVRAKGAKGTSTEGGDSRCGMMAAAWRKLPHALTLRLGPFLAARIPY